MALAYLDTSALAKRYLPEVGSVWVAHLCRQEAVVISLVAIPELASALARRAREGALSAKPAFLCLVVYQPTGIALR